MSENQIEIGKHKLPMNGYDILGYIIPGVLFILLVYGFECFINLKSPDGMIKLPIFQLIKSIQLGAIKGLLSSIIIIGIIVICAYIIGHLLATGASFIADHMFIQKGHGYPYETLLGLHKTTYTEHTASQAFHLGNFFWLNAYIVIKFICFFSGSTNPYYIPRIVACYILSVVALKIIYHQKLFFHNKIKSSGFGKYFIWFVTKIHSAPYFVLHNLLLTIFKTKTTFDQDFLNDYAEKFGKRFGMDYTTAGTNNFWLTYIYVVENGSNLSPLLTNWLRLYSFARNLSFTFYLASIYILIDLKVQREMFLANPIPELHILALTSIFLAFMFLARYVYLYYSYFSKFNFRAFVSIQDNQPKENVE